MISELEKCEYVYHYTYFESLLSILEFYRQQKFHNALPFKATCIYNVNDPTEMERGISALKRFLPEYENSITNNLGLSEVFTEEQYEEKCIKQFNHRDNGSMIENGVIPYTTSFSLKKDFLPMWSMYGNSGYGVCLKFNLKKIVEMLPDRHLFGMVSYDESTEKKALNEILPLLYKYTLNDTTPPMTIEDKINEVSSILLNVSPFMKKEEYEYEQEFRIAYYKYYGDEIDPFSSKEAKRRKMLNVINNGMSKSVIVPFQYIPINANSLEEIIIGPKAEYNVIEHVLRNELKECLLNKVLITESLIPIK